MQATADDWQRQPFGECIPISYRSTFAPEDVARLQAGLIPRAMEDKWFVYFESPNLYFHRSWTGMPVYIVTIEDTAEGAFVSGAQWSKALADEPGADPAYQARLLHFLVSNLLLGKQEPFPLPDHASALPGGVYQHHLAGTGYPETLTKNVATGLQAADGAKPKRRLRDRASALLNLCVVGIAAAGILVSSLWRKGFGRKRASPPHRDSNGH